jgi:hypothetical protein
VWWPRARSTLRAAVPADLKAALEVEVVEAMGNPAEEQGTRSKKRFDSVYTKLRVWGLTRYDVVVFLDADMVVLRDVAELFDTRPGFAATAYEPYSSTHGRHFFDSASMVLRWVAPPLPVERQCQASPGNAARRTATVCRSEHGALCYGQAE